MRVYLIFKCVLNNKNQLESWSQTVLLYKNNVTVRSHAKLLTS